MYNVYAELYCNCLEHQILKDVKYFKANKQPFFRSLKNCNASAVSYSPIEPHT